MDSHYSACYSFPLYEPPRFAEESKAVYVGDEQESAIDEKDLDSATAIHPDSASGSRRASVLKVKDEFTANSTSAATISNQMWSDRAHENYPMRSYTTPHAHMMNGNNQSFARMNDPAFTQGLQHANTWSVSHSGATTPTPMYSQVFDMQYAQPTSTFATYAHDPTSATPMSPQSSQGGWASATSSDGTDQRGLISPTYRPTSPGTVMRPDGIRKKNARFEIPKERNLANIDAMIMASTDETEKKELKQQKRLLRNRQAALDSRQRKKTHTEKLEQEKKISEKRLLDMEEGLGSLENTLNMEREQFVQQRQHMENLVHALRYERDEAIRTKTLETAELRRQLLILEDCVKDLERQQQHNTNHRDFNDLDFNWDNEFPSIDEHELSLEEQRQVTPKPPASTFGPSDAKAENGFSWSTFYMCLLFGAFIASNGNNNNVDNNAASAIASSIPSVEAGNVLKTVLNSGHVVNDLIAGNSEAAASSATNAVNSIHTSHMETHLSPSNLDHLHQSLSTPSRRQEMASAFSMSASTYQHLTDPFNEQVDIDADSDLLEPPPPPQPSALQKAFASLQAQKDNLDKLTGMGSKARERSVLWDQVPPEVVKNFEALIQQNSNGKTSMDIESMEQ